MNISLNINIFICIHPVFVTQMYLYLSKSRIYLSYTANVTSFCIPGKAAVRWRQEKQTLYRKLSCAWLGTSVTPCMARFLRGEIDKKLDFLTFREHIALSCMLDSPGVAGAVLQTAL